MKFVLLSLLFFYKSWIEAITTPNVTTPVADLPLINETLSPANETMTTTTATPTTTTATTSTTTSSPPTTTRSPTTIKIPFNETLSCEQYFALSYSVMPFYSTTLLPPNASSFALHFDYMNLHKGDTLIITSPAHDGEAMSFMIYTKQDILNHTLTTPFYHNSKVYLNFHIREPYKVENEEEETCYGFHMDYYMIQTKG